MVAGDPKLGFAANFLYTLTGKKPDEVMERAFDVALVLHAEHELNASTFAARVTAATLSDIYSSVTSAIGALKGPLHGGANEEVIRLLLDARPRRKKAIERVKDMLANKIKIPGLGHRVYHTLDPRAALPQGHGQGTRRAHRPHEAVRNLQRDSGLCKEAKNLNANVDFFLRQHVLFAGHSGGSVHADFRRQPHVRLDRAHSGAVSQQPPDPASRGLHRRSRGQGLGRHRQTARTPHVYDLSFFRNNLDAIAKRLADRGFTLDVEAFRKLDAERRAALAESEQLKAQRNAESQEIGKLKKAGQDTSERQQKVREMADRMAALDQTAEALDNEFRQMMAGVPNTAARIRARPGKAPDDNVEVRRWGTPPEFSFPPKAHWDLGPELGILDFDRAAKITGARFAVYLGSGREAGAGADQLHAGRAYAPSRLHGGAAAVHGQLGQPVRHRPVAQVRGRFVQDRGHRLSG